MFNKLACSKRKPNILSLNISPNNIFSYIETSPSDVVHPEGLFLIAVSIDMVIRKNLFTDMHNEFFTYKEKRRPLFRGCRFFSYFSSQYIFTYFSASSCVISYGFCTREIVCSLVCPNF